MKAVELKPGIYWVGVKDWNLRDFHRYKVEDGSTYNAYLIVDDKVTLIDTVEEPFKEMFLARIASVIDPAKIDVVICNHVEMDHSGCLPAIMEIAENATIYCSAMCQKGLGLHYDTSSWKMKTVKEGDSISIGKHTLHFTPIPMVHWPDSMMTYVPESKILFPNDAFGQHYAADNLFDNQDIDIIFDEAKKYYGNIVMPYGAQTQKALAAALKLDFDMIAPSHGAIWRDHIPEIVKKYQLWSTYGNIPDKAVVIYDTMWGSTEIMAREVMSAWGDKDLKVTLCSLKHTALSKVIGDIVEAKYVAFGSPTLNSGILTKIGALMTYMKGLAPKNKVGFCFGSYGWKKDALKEVETVLTGLGWEVPEPMSVINYRPTPETLKGLYEAAQRVIK